MSWGGEVQRTAARGSSSLAVSLGLHMGLPRSPAPSPGTLPYTNHVGGREARETPVRANAKRITRKTLSSNEKKQNKRDYAVVAVPIKTRAGVMFTHRLNRSRKRAGAAALVSGNVSEMRRATAEKRRGD